MDQLQLTGGARIGLLHASWPFSRLTVTKDRLDLSASLIGTFSFTRDQIISIEPCGVIPLLNRGIRINHTVVNYNERIIFTCGMAPEKIIEKIRESGFMDQPASAIDPQIKNDVMEQQKQGGFPIKVPVAISVVVIWITLFFIDGINYLRNEQNPFPFGKGILLAIGFLLIVSTLTLFSRGFQKMILKDVRDIKEVNRFLYFVIMLCGFMLIVIFISQRRMM
ncbi:MAG: hypothetical protein JST75_15860 [Bacteroidetes bacterium]|nr:hypothetical protein [Bacteroidota bacterium]